MEQYEYRNGPPAPRMVAELAMRHDALVKQLADAQATIAALQADIKAKDSRIWELESWLQVKSPQEITLMESKIIQLEHQLTQRTAELEAAKQWKLQLCNLTPGGSEFADDPAYCAEWVRKSRENQHNVILDKYREAKALKAELERVRGERDALREQNRVLREALKPFAERWEYFERVPPVNGKEWDYYHCYADEEPSFVYLGQLKAAKAALTATSQEGQHG